MDASARAQTFQQKKKNPGKKKQQVYSGDIVFTKNGSLQTIPALNKRLKAITDPVIPVIGLHYVWEYRSPSQSVAPHYQCRLCKVQRLQNEMVAHITGWRHCFKYLKHAHLEKMPHGEEEAAKSPAIKKEIRVIAAEVENAEGRGRIKVGISKCNPNMYTSFIFCNLLHALKKLCLNVLRESIHHIQYTFSGMCLFRMRSNYFCCSVCFLLLELPGHIVV